MPCLRDLLTIDLSHGSLVVKCKTGERGVAKMQRKTPITSQHKSDRKLPQQMKPGTPFSARQRMLQQKTNQEQNTAAEIALSKAAEVQSRAWDIAREDLYDMAAWEEYEKACRDYWQKSLDLRSISPEVRAKLEAEHAVFPPCYEQSFRQAKAGDGHNLEPLVLFLEADPYVLRSGYAKEAAIGALKQVPEITPHYADRLRTVILHIVDRRWGREFRAYCRLAVRVDSPEFRNALEQRRSHPQANDPEVSIRARRVLDLLYQNDRMQCHKK